MNILLVENDALVYRHTEKLLQSEGYHVVQWQDGSMIDSYHKAIEMLSAYPINLTILDIELNGEKDGLDIGSYIAEYFPKMPFLFLSNYNNIENFLRAGRAGASDFLDKMEKPFTDNQLKRKLLILRPKMEAATGPETEGAVFNVEEFNAKTQQQSPDFFRKVIKWKEVITITSYDPVSNYAKRNNIFFYMKDMKTYRCHEPLKNIDPFLPQFITRFNDQEIVNVHCIEGRGKSDLVCLINGKRFTINEANKEKALKAIRLFLPPNF